MVQVEFAASDAATALTQEPTRVGYSQHEGVEVARWGDVKLEVVDGTHPVVHPAAGSHANYYDAALFLGRSGQQGFGCDDTRAPGSGLRPAVALVPSDASRRRRRLPVARLHRPLGPAREELLQRPDRPEHQGPVDRSAHLDRHRGRRHRVRRAGQRAVRHPGDQRVLRHRRQRLGRAAGGDQQPRRGGAGARGARRPHRVAGAPHDVVARPPRCGWRAGAAPARSSPRCGGCTCGASCCSPASASPIAVATLLPGVATVWMTSTAESLDGNPTLYGARRHRRRAGAGPAVADHPVDRRGGRDGRRPRDRRGSPGRHPRAPTAAPCGAPSRCCSPRPPSPSC